MDQLSNADASGETPFARKSVPWRRQSTTCVSDTEDIRAPADSRWINI